MDNGRVASTSSGNSVDAAGQVRGLGPASSRPRSATQEGSGSGSGSGSHSAVKCPRCESLNTKFCYYNNYSQAQPRHFCKSCRRYWTEGGALRNVPVGGGCRKNKRLKQRSLMNMGVPTAGILDGSSFMDGTTSNMLARLTNTSPTFPNFPGAASGFARNDSGSQFLNLMFSRFQDPMRLGQSCDQGPAAAGVTPYLDVGFPGLVQMKHGAAAPPNCAFDGCESQPWGGSLGFGTWPCKGGGHDVGMTAFRNGGYELSSVYHDRSSNMHTLGTSATATLDSLQDQLTSFSNLQQPDAFHTDTTTITGLEQKSCGSMEDSQSGMVVEGPPPQHFICHANDPVETLAESVFNFDIQAERDIDEKPLSNRIAVNNELSLSMNMDTNWQQPPLMMNDILMESQTSSLWISPPTTRWQDGMHSLAAPPATAAGSVL